jgi:hypothetical protein
LATCDTSMQFGDHVGVAPGTALPFMSSVAGLAVRWACWSIWTS